MDHLIWPKPETIDFKSYTQEDWISIVRYAQRTFAYFMKMPIAFQSLTTASIGAGFCLDMKGWEGHGGPIGLSWHGILGGVPLEEAGYLHISASLFLYVDTQKVVSHAGDSFLEVVFEKASTGEGEWRLKGWEPDIYGEYEYFNTYESLDRN